MSPMVPNPDPKQNWNNWKNDMRPIRRDLTSSSYTTGGKRIANSCAKTAWELWRNGTVVFNNSFYYTRSWYTLWLVNCDCLLQHCRQLFSFASAEEVGFMACSRFYRHPVFGVIQQVQVNTACKPRSLNLRSAVCGTVCSLHMSHALLSLDQWIVNYTFCIELNFYSGDTLEAEASVP